MIARTSIALAVTLFAGAAQAAPAPLTANQMLQQFNAVVTENLTSNSHVDGRTYVGGNATGGDYGQNGKAMPASEYAGLTVRGNVSGNTKVNGQGAVIGGNATGINVNSGEAYVGGAASNSSFNGGNVWIEGAASNVNFSKNIHAASYQNINLNGKVLAATTATMDSTKAASTSTDFSAVMKGLSTQLSAMKATAGASVEFSNNNRVATFNGSGVDGVLVFDLTELDSTIFSGAISDLNFNLSNASTVIFNTDDKVLNLFANFNQAQSLGSKLVWNFAGADTSVTIGRTFGGQVLVADGTFSNVGGANIEGGVFAENLVQNGEIHLQAFTGTIPTVTSPVPEADTWTMLVAGLGMLGLIGRRRKNARAVQQ